MPCYPHMCKSCQHEWEDTYHINDPIPDTCPKCGFKGQVQRLISQPPGVKVELYGRDLVNQLRKEGKELAKQARKDEYLAHNLYGGSIDD